MTVGRQATWESCAFFHVGKRARQRSGLLRADDSAHTSQPPSIFWRFKPQLPDIVRLLQGYLKKHKYLNPQTPQTGREAEPTKGEVHGGNGQIKALNTSECYTSVFNAGRYHSRTVNPHRWDERISYGGNSFSLQFDDTEQYSRALQPAQQTRSLNCLQLAKQVVDLSLTLFPPVATQVRSQRSSSRTHQTGFPASYIETPRTVRCTACGLAAPCLVPHSLSKH